MTQYTVCPRCGAKAMYSDDDKECYHCTACGVELIDRKVVKGKWRLNDSR